MFVQFVKFVASPLFKIGVEAATAFAIGDKVNAAAKAYATKAVGEEVARIPETLAVAANVCTAVQTGGISLGFTGIADAYNAFNVTKNALYTPWRLQHHARNFQFLKDIKNDGCDYQLDQDDEDADLCVMRPSF